jgi:hypothetical protein
MSLHLAQITSPNTVTPRSSSKDSLWPPKMSDGRQFVLVIVPCIALGIALIITGIVVARKLQRNARRNALPVTEKTFLQRHLESLRYWQTPVASASCSAFEADPNHIPLTLAQPAPTHPPSSTTNPSWKKFQDEQKRRQIQAEQPAIPFEPWVYRPKGPAYWCQVGQEMQARRSWWEKMKDRMGL